MARNADTRTTTPEEDLAALEADIRAAEAEIRAASEKQKQ